MQIPVFINKFYVYTTKHNFFIELNFQTSPESESPKIIICMTPEGAKSLEMVLSDLTKRHEERSGSKIEEWKKTEHKEKGGLKVTSSSGAEII